MTYTELVHEPRRFPDGTADWKSAYDDLTDVQTALRRELLAIQAAMAALIDRQVRDWLDLRAAKFFAEADALKARMETAGIVLQVLPPNGNPIARWHVQGTLVQGEMRRPT